MILSFIIPVYNASSSIERCLTSIIPYLNMGCEAVVVNDGSIDDSRKLIEDFMIHHSGIRLINQENRGQSIARNVAISQAHGEYIWCLDSDDWLSSEGIDEIINTLNNRKNDVVVIGRVEEYKDYCKATPDLFLKEYAKGLDFFEEAALKDIYRTQPWNMIVRRAILSDNDILFPEGRTFEDFYWGIKILVHAGTTLMLPLHPYHYLLDNSESLTKQIHKRDGDIVWIIDKTAEMLDENNSTITSESPSFLALTYWFVSSAIMKKYTPLYHDNTEARKIVDCVQSNKIFRKSARYAAFHYIGIVKTGLALLFLLSKRLYCMLLGMMLSSSYTSSKR